MKSVISLLVFLQVIATGFGQSPIEHCTKALQELEVYSLNVTLGIEVMGQQQQSGFTFLFEKDDSPENEIKVRFNLTSPEVEMTYTGQERWIAEHGQKVLIVDPQPDPLLLHELMPLWFSPHWIGHVLASAEDSPGVSLEEITAYSYRIIFEETFVGLNGEIMEIPGSMRTFQLTLDSTKNFPIELSEEGSDPMAPTVTAQYSDFNGAPSISPDQWSYDRFTRDYPVFSRNEFLQLGESKMRDLEGQVAPEIAEQTLDGKPFVLAEQLGKPVLLIFWFPNCGALETSIEGLNEKTKRFQEWGGVVAGIEFSNTPANYLADYIAKQGIHFPVIQNGRATSLSYGVSGSPTVVIIDREGMVKSMGSFDPEQIETQIDELFKSNGK